MIPEIRTVPHPVSQREYPAALCGTIAPLFTPERLDGRIDFDGLEQLTDHLCRKSSVSSILIRSGESRMWAYTLEEIRDTIRAVIQVAKGRKPVIACTAGPWDGDPSRPPRPAVYFRRTADLSQWALFQGAAAVMQPVPHFLERGVDYTAQDVVFRYFEDMAKAVSGPMLIYNPEALPLGYALTPASLKRLSIYPQFLGVIYATKDASLLAEIIRVCDPRFAVISGCDSVAVPAFMSGVSSSAGAIAALAPEVIDAAWQSLHEPNLPFVWRAQTDLLRIRELLSPWPAGDIGCALMVRQGVQMATRCRAATTLPDRHEVERVSREITSLRAAYM